MKAGELTKLILDGWLQMLHLSHTAMRESLCEGEPNILPTCFTESKVLKKLRLG